MSLAQQLDLETWKTFLGKKVTLILKVKNAMKKDKPWFLGVSQAVMRLVHF